MFKQRENWYDVCCDVETGKVMTSPNPKYDYKNETYYTTDLEFISIILNKMRNYRITEEEIRSSFAEYTQIILDLAMGEQDYLIDPSLNQTLVYIYIYIYLITIGEHPMAPYPIPKAYT